MKKRQCCQMKTKKRLKKSKNVPVRTCLGCFKTGVKLELIRFVLQGPKLVIDPLAEKEGRGVYCCKSRKCLQQMVRKKKRLIVAFRASIQEKEIETDCAEEIYEIP